MEENVRVAVIKSHEIVVMRGVIKKLEDMGYEIIQIDEKPSEIDRVADSVHLFVMYLTSDILSAVKTTSNAMAVVDAIGNNNHQALIVGEERQLEDIAKVIISLRDHVWIDRPVNMEELEEKAEALVSARINQRIKRILVIDDDPDFGRVIRDWLKDDYQVNVVVAGMQAITFLAKKEVDLILLDYEMPIVDGPQVLEMLRSDPATSSIPVVFLTGVSTKEQVQRVVSLNPQGYILKSTSKIDLLNYLKGLFEN